MAEDTPPTEDSVADDDGRKANLLKTGIGLGVGSAALVAALLYASRSRRKKKGNVTTIVPEDTD